MVIHPIKVYLIKKIARSISRRDLDAALRSTASFETAVSKDI